MTPRQIEKELARVHAARRRDREKAARQRAREAEALAKIYVPPLPGPIDVMVNGRVIRFDAALAQRIEDVAYAAAREFDSEAEPEAREMLGAVLNELERAGIVFIMPPEVQ